MSLQPLQLVNLLLLLWIPVLLLNLVYSLWPEDLISSFYSKCKPGSLTLLVPSEGTVNGISVNILQYFVNKLASQKWSSHPGLRFMTAPGAQAWSDVMLLLASQPLSIFCWLVRCWSTSLPFRTVPWSLDYAVSIWVPEGLLSLCGQCWFLLAAQKIA